MQKKMQYTGRHRLHGDCSWRRWGIIPVLTALLVFAQIHTGMSANKGVNQAVSIELHNENEVILFPVKPTIGTREEFSGQSSICMLAVAGPVGTDLVGIETTAPLGFVLVRYRMKLDNLTRCQAFFWPSDKGPKSQSASLIFAPVSLYPNNRCCAISHPFKGALS